MNLQWKPDTNPQLRKDTQVQDLYVNGAAVTMFYVHKTRDMWRGVAAVHSKSIMAPTEAEAKAWVEAVYLLEET